MRAFLSGVYLAAEEKVSNLDKQKASGKGLMQLSEDILQPYSWKMINKKPVKTVGYQKLKEVDEL